MAQPQFKTVSRDSPPADRSQPVPSQVVVLLAFAAVYLIWGSTYLAIRYAIETLPPFLMAATRFLVAGGILFLWSIWNGSSIRVPFVQWRRAFIVGGLLLLCGNGGVTWAEKYIASGLAALLVATEPFWIVALIWGLTHKRPNAKVMVGVLIGMAGVALLIGGGLRESNSGSTMSLVGTFIVLASSFAWAAGSVYSNRRPICASTTMAAGLQMLAGGFLLLLMGLLTGDFKRLNLNNASLVSLGALTYLTVFGSVIVFTAYSWLLRNIAPARVATYAYVNPVVAVFLGGLIANEPLTLRMMIAAAIIIVSVVLITTFGKETAKAPGKGDLHTTDSPAHPCA